MGGGSETQSSQQMWEGVGGFLPRTRFHLLKSRFPGGAELGASGCGQVSFLSSVFVHERCRFWELDVIDPWIGEIWVLEFTFP